jgi:outer membrane biosynthesis protein TonB
MLRRSGDTPFLQRTQCSKEALEEPITLWYYSRNRVLKRQGASRMPRLIVVICAGIVATGLLVGFARAMDAAAPRSAPQAPLLALTETVEVRPTETPPPTTPPETPPPTTPPETPPPTTPPETPPPTTPPETPPPTTPPETPPPTTPPETPPPTTPPPGTPVQEQQQQTVTPVSVGTPTPTPTVPVPVTLPGTGAPVAGGAPLMLVLIALLVIAGGLLARSRKA